MSAPPPNAGALVGTRLGDYELVALLALGGTAEIYLARVGGHAGFEKYVVVKCLHDHLAYDPEFVQMFLDEARLGAQLDHSNIVQTLGLGEQDGRYYLVMEFIAGMSVALMARRTAERVGGGRIPPPLVLGLAIQSAAGLHYAHQRQSNGASLNLVHRDISPQNLVVTFEGVVKIVDFGIAKAEERATATRAGTIKGKFAYMSPEQCVAKHVDRRTDVFALGVVIHELLTGRRLFKRNSTYDTYQAILECKVPPPSAVNHELDPALDPVILAALAKDADRRYPTAEVFGEAISAYLHRGGKHAGSGDISTFIEHFFQPEIADHGDRMRELLEGRGAAAAGWDNGEEALELSGQDVVDDGGPPAGFAAGAIGFAAARRGGSDDGEAPAESTRIEMNPLDRLAELNEQVRLSGAFPAATAPPTAAPIAAPVAPPPSAPAARRPDRPTPPPTPPSVRPPAPVFAAAKPGGSIFGNPTTPKPAQPPSPPASAGSEPLKIASLFGGNTPIAKRRPGELPSIPLPRRAPPEPSMLSAGGAVPSSSQPPARSGGFGNAAMPTVLAEPEPTPSTRGPAAPAGAATMSLDLAEVIADLGTGSGANQPPRARSRADYLTEPAPILPPNYQATAYGTPPGTQTARGEPGGYVHTPMPTHLVDLPPAETYPGWDGSYPPQRRAMPPWLLAVLFLVAIGAATGITITIARLAS